MIRFSIIFLAFFSFGFLAPGQSQNPIAFTCYNLDSISWKISLPTCPSPLVDSFRVFTRQNQGSALEIAYSGSNASIRGFRSDSLKTAQEIMVQYFIRCPGQRVVNSDTISLYDLREAVVLDTIRVLANGDVELTWRQKPIADIRYVVNAAVQGSSQVLATNLRENHYTDHRGLATRNVEYYSISAALDCGYTIPEPDRFYHTSLLDYNIAKCGGEVNFDFTPFSYWPDSTTGAELIVERNGHPEDTVTLSAGQSSFAYNGLENSESYTFYVKEFGPHPQTQVAFSNPITFNTDFYEPIRWIVIDELTMDDQNMATLSWINNNHQPGQPFQILLNGTVQDIPDADIIIHSGGNRYSYMIPGYTPDATGYSISLQDSCGNTVESLPKKALFTQGQLNGGSDLNIEWTDIADTEWTVNSYDIYYQTNGTYALLGSVNGSTLNFQHAFDENNPLDSLCYYVVARGEVYFMDIDSSAELSIRSNTVCLYGETVVQLPNAYRPGQVPYRPIIVPQTNIASYTFRVFDRYGSLVFKTNNPVEGWNGQLQGKHGFMEVYVVQVEMKNVQGEQIEKSGSVLLFP